jgi:hypothetical protein
MEDARHGAATARTEQDNEAGLSLDSRTSEAGDGDATKERLAVDLMLQSLSAELKLRLRASRIEEH